LNSIAAYISSDSEYVAKKFVQQLIYKAKILLSHPSKGPSIPENIPGIYRQILHKSYRFIYKIHKNDVVNS
jgi:plasmid stabilization system protein ParE